MGAFEFSRCLFFQEEERAKREEEEQLKRLEELEKQREEQVQPDRSFQSPISPCYDL